MPELIKLYIRHVVIGFALSGVFVAALLWMNVANLWHLVSTSNIGWIAVAMLFVGHGIGEDRGPQGGTRAPVATNIPVKVEAVARERR